MSAGRSFASAIVEALGCHGRAAREALLGKAEAAEGAGLQVLLCVREGNAVQPHADKYEAVLSFDRL